MREREPVVTHDDFTRDPVIHCIQRGWTAVGGVRCSINRTIGNFKHCNSPQAATASDVAVLFSISFRRSSPCRETDGLVTRSFAPFTFFRTLNGFTPHRIMPTTPAMRPPNSHLQRVT